jgi:hypothetical protein
LLESHISYVKIKTFLNQTLIPKQYEWRKLGIRD